MSSCRYAIRNKFLPKICIILCIWRLWDWNIFEKVSPPPYDLNAAWIIWRNIYHIATIKQTMFERTGEVSNWFLLLLLADSSIDGDNTLVISAWLVTDLWLRNHQTKFQSRQRRSVKQKDVHHQVVEWFLMRVLPHVMMVVVVVPGLESGPVCDPARGNYCISTLASVRER